MMKTLSIFLLFTLALSCSPKATVTIPPKKQFVLGEYQDSRFSVKVSNKSKLPLKVEVWNKNNEKTSSFGMDGHQSNKFSIDRDEKVILKNPNNQVIQFGAVFNRSVQGMRYEDITNDKTDVIGNMTLARKDLEGMIFDGWEGEIIYIDPESNDTSRYVSQMSVTKPERDVYLFDIKSEDEIIPQGIGGRKVLSNLNKWFGGKQVLHIERNLGRMKFITLDLNEDEEVNYNTYITYEISDTELTISEEYQEFGSDDLNLIRKMSYTKNTN